MEIERYITPPEVIIPDEIIPPDGRFFVREEQTMEGVLWEDYYRRVEQRIKTDLFGFHFSKFDPNLMNNVRVRVNKDGKVVRIEDER